MTDDHITSHLISILEITYKENFAYDQETIEACINCLIHVIEYAAYPFILNKKPKPFSNSIFFKKYLVSY